MSDLINSFNENDFDDFDTESLLDEDLPENHRSGFVAVIGRPNVGKSTLMNHFLGQKIAIVSPKPQTTRDQLLGILTLPTEAGDLADLPPAQIIFVDTPGIHRPHHKLGEHLVETAQEAITDADIILWLVDASQPSTEADSLAAQSLHEAKRVVGQRGDFPPVLLGLNKVDLIELQQLKGVELPFLDLFPVEAWLPLSAISSQHRLALLRLLIDHLPPGPRYFPAEQVTDQQTRFIAAELVREAALTVLHQEVPHALAVRVTEFKQRHENLVYVSANIIVERSSQKQIVIGQKGRTLRQIGKLARAQIEELVESKVYLDLWVKVRPKWRKKESELRWLGYAPKK